MRILMLVNWKIEYISKRPDDKQPPDYYIYGDKYWFFRYFDQPVDVDVIDIHSCKLIENFEKNNLRFYIIQTFISLLKIKNYDLILSHGMQSGIVLALIRRIFRTRAKHVVFDIGSFNSAAEKGAALKLMEFASKSIDGVIYHTSSQINYYRRFFPWLLNKSEFIRFGADMEFFGIHALEKSKDSNSYILCVGYSKRDWDTLVQAYQLLQTDIKLRLVGHINESYKNIKGIEQLPFIPVNELKSQIYNAQFCVLPLESFNYSYGQMTLLQQMSFCKLVVAARVPSISDYVDDGKTALLYEAGNIYDCAKVINFAIRNKEIRERIGNSAYMFLKDKCNEKIMAKEVEKILKTTLEG
ncbi:MAG: hypothetical protein K0R21_26 [Anaerocolumna sp.]|nr:hypothetical protein [Anaerocolumna sp.]